LKKCRNSPSRVTSTISTPLFIRQCAQSNPKPMNSPEQFAARARSYVERALPHGSIAEKQKLVDDWLDKEHAATDILIDFKKRVGDPTGKRVLDLGFGNGITLATFAQAGVRMSGVEVSHELLGIAGDYAHEHNVVA